MRLREVPLATSYIVWHVMFNESARLNLAQQMCREKGEGVRHWYVHIFCCLVQNQTHQHNYAILS